MLNKVLQLLSLSCKHRKTTKPFAAAVAANVNRSSSAEWESVSSGPGHYVVCLDCGKKFAYDWANMRIMR
jgi:hypothetical protein